MIYYITAFFISLVYAILIRYIIVGWNNTKERSDYDNKIGFSIIIPAKNEERNIGSCLQSVLNTNYPSHMYEVIVVDDNSDDQTFSIVEKFQSKVQLINQNENYGKKNALTKGIKVAKYDYIITLDADCSVNENWLGSMAAKFDDNKADVVVGPIKIKVKDNDMFSTFEYYDTAAMMAITANGIIREKYYLANGANLAYKKSVFKSVGGYEANNDIASGDDVFLVNNAAQKGHKIVFSKSLDSAVTTLSQIDFKALLSQRKRWATKTNYYANTNILGIQAIVFGISIYIVTALIFGPFFSLEFTFSGLLVMVSKMVVDYLFLSKVTSHFDNSSKMNLFLTCFFFYLFMILYMGMQALLPSEYLWKGKKMR